MNSLKRMAKAWLLMNGAFVLLVMATQPAMANESQSLGLDLDSILRALPAARRTPPVSDQKDSHGGHENSRPRCRELCPRPER
ncbi:Uncharacterised protein [Klebsiella pneumoniae]|uniref:hypothetical protein n=1 Tax=Klebsiella pneumoniae TaxID=573 RepID=UPI000E2C1DE6|nr:hypothetical protein [Klebsiella pneumoniae]SYU12051.1 Uncharacterised protein [Klebsiella pneumoniae]